MSKSKEKPDIRWKRRFENFDRAFKLFRFSMEKFADSDEEIPEDTQELEGAIKRFEFAYELAWKTLKDKMEFDGVVIPEISPKKVVKLASQNKYISNVEAWIAMVNDRNLLSHSYSFPGFKEILHRSLHQHLPALADFHEKLSIEIIENE